MAGRNDERGRKPRPPSLKRVEAHLTLLGDFSVKDRATGVFRIPHASQRVLALAALHGGTLSRRTAALRIWPHLPSRSALASLRTAVSRLHAAHPTLIVSDAEALALAAPVQVDVCQHEAQALRLIRGSSDDLECAVPVAEFTMPLLPGWQDEWVLIERQRLQELFLHALEAHARDLADRGQFAMALTAIYAVLRVDPLRESAARALISTHLAEGNRAQAARSYLEFRQQLLAGLGMEPSAELRSMVDGLLPSSGD